MFVTRHRPPREPLASVGVIRQIEATLICTVNEANPMTSEEFLDRYVFSVETGGNQVIDDVLRPTKAQSRLWPWSVRTS